MKAFIATKVAGEDKDSLLMFLARVEDAFSGTGIEPYITELAPPQLEDGKKLLRAFEHIAERELLIVIYKMGAASEGMSAEIGYAYGRVPIWIFAEEGSDSKLFALSDKLVFWKDEADLLGRIREAR
ncbi:MAG: hypothetical protein WAW63_03895 [Candidatus Saccharimonadales bacterium]